MGLERIRTTSDLKPGDVAVFCDHGAERDVTVLRVTTRFLFVDTPWTGTGETRFDRVTGLKNSRSGKQVLRTHDQMGARVLANKALTELGRLGITVLAIGELSPEEQGIFVGRLYEFVSSEIQSIKKRRSQG